MTAGARESHDAPLAGADGFAAVSRGVPLCVDLDLTLLRTDTLWECVAALWRRPLVALAAAWALLTRGKAGFKQSLAESIVLDPSTLPVRQDVLDFLLAERAAGRELVLATAAHRIVAQSVASHLGIFDRVFATEGDTNLGGATKAAALEAAFGRKGFDYIGDSIKDLPIFLAARQGYLVDPSGGLLRKVSASGEVARVFTAPPRPAARTIFRALRVHQWSKNVLLVIPLLAAHQFLASDAWVAAGIAFLSFSLVASATYLLNDLLDLRADRLHPKKRSRPLASGDLSIPAGFLLVGALGAIGFAAASAFLPPMATGYLVLYAALTLAYSIDLKKRVLVDAIALAVLYTLRILLGGAAIGVPVSEWLLMFSLFIFISLAFLKRLIEVRDLRETRSEQLAPGRGYAAGDLETMRTVGICSGLMSILVLALYISSQEVRVLYRSPALLWLVCPVLIYWIARIWFMAGRGQVHHDPIVFALLDTRSYGVAACIALTAFLAKVGLGGALS